MARTVLILGRDEAVVGAARTQLAHPDIRVLSGLGLEDLRSTLATTQIDHVIIGGALDLATRLQMVREVFQLNRATTVHLKDGPSGAEGFLPFCRSVLDGMSKYKIQTRD